MKGQQVSQGFTSDVMHHLFLLMLLQTTASSLKAAVWSQTYIK